METVWFILVAVMLTGYVVLDGFDIGAGALHLIAARTDDERRLLLRTIGPVWDGNEVWLLAAGGTLFYAFPLLYASSFSGFYLPLNIVLWLLVLRAIGIEFRMHIDAKIWTDFFDFLFSAASVLLAIFFGAALGNVIRGVPLGPDHYFFAPLWTDFRTGAQPGVLDWYTVLSAVVALVALMLHGSLWVAMKTEGPLNIRMRSLVRVLLPSTAVLTIANLAATIAIRPGLLDNYRANPAGWVIPAAVVATLAGIAWFHHSGRERIAFLCCCGYIGAMLAGAAFALYPVLLPASTGPANDITIYNAATGRNSLAVGLVWWSAGMLVAVGYFVFIYWLFAGKVRVRTGGEGY